MRDHTWWKRLHWFEYGAELLGTAFLVFAGVSAVVFVFGTGSPLAQILPDTSTRRLIAGLLLILTTERHGISVRLSHCLSLNSARSAVFLNGRGLGLTSAQKSQRDNREDEN
jgi:glycerol uptake facilitator-like aquaporin